MAEERAAEPISIAKARALTRAVGDSRLGDGAIRLLVVALDHLCRRDGPDYGTFWCSVKTLADKSTLSMRAVARWLCQLVDCGYLDRVSTGGGRDRSGGGRATVYRLATLPKMAALPIVAELTMPNSATLPVLTGNPAKNGNRTLPKMADNPRESILENDPDARAREALVQFEMTFWPKYPLKNAPGSAVRAFVTARGKASLEEIMAGLDRYLASKPDWQQWAHAATWLNQERWRDQGETSRGASDLTGDPARRRKHALWAVPRGFHVLTGLEPTGDEIAMLVREGAIEIAAAAKFCGAGTVAAFAHRHGIRLQGEMVMGLNSKKAAS